MRSSDERRGAGSPQEHAAGPGAAPGPGPGEEPGPGPGGEPRAYRGGPARRPARRIRLERNGPLRASALAEEFHLDKGAVSRRLSHLDELGFVERTPDPADGRATLVAVTPEGKQQLAQAEEHRQTWLEERMNGWSEADLDLLVTMLGRYNAALAEG